MPIQNDNSSNQMVVALRKICNDHKFVYFTDEITQQVVDGIEGLKDCRLLKIPFPIYPGWLTFHLRHGSPYLKQFNRM